MMTPLYDWFGKRSFAQSGEDIIADIVLGRKNASKLTRWIYPFGYQRPTQVGNDKKKRNGIYVDVGAYHPKLFSNTYLFYKKGWRGICVDPNPEVGKMFRLARPRDVFLNVGVGDVGGSWMPDQVRHDDYKVKSGSGLPQLVPSKGVSMEVEIRNDVKIVTAGRLPREYARNNMTYFMFDEATANTFSQEQAKKNQEVGRKLINTKTVEILSLKKILDKYLAKGEKIDLLSVDVEGMDLEVLQSNDWKKYRPKVVICEDLGFDLDKYGGWSRPVAGDEARINNKPGLPREYTRNDKELQGWSLKGVAGKLDCHANTLAMTGGVVGYLQSLGYKLKAVTPYSLIFKDI